MWQKIDGYEDYYEVSSDGKVRSVDRSFFQYGNNGSYFQRTYKGRILKQEKNRDGYLKVVLAKDGKKTLKSVHRLVAEAFIPNPENKPCIDHINGDKTFNDVSNLRWATYSENSRNPITFEKTKNALKGSHLCAWRGHFGKEHPMSKTVGQYDLDNNFIAEYGSVSEASRKLGISRTCIGDCCNGKKNTANGFIFKYL